MIEIKNMKMPKSCAECPFKANDYVCGLLDCAFSCNHFKERNYNCPLVEIVTCKDCTNYVKGALDEEICLRGHELIHENFYCSDGERGE